MNLSVVKKPAVFLDRDGVINKRMLEGDYVKNWSEFSFLPGVLKAVRMLKENGFLITVVTNQRCIARGIITEKGLKEIHERMLHEIRKYGGNIDAIYFCPHDVSDGCGCRKPKPGMILRAIKDFKDYGIEIDLEKSYVIGDSEKDIIPAKVVGLKAIKIGWYSPVADINKKNLLEAIKAIIECD
jgi:D-glycero-D-manno-heptose 1,7-bisphosphate phosphatase